uniref:AlNc14C678G12389 protein n=1 Tax=Albugo laibachii Nc14 TaxID=890382 RepID=F0X1S5_9STRA|nr:AlNc14C678G12389 [Albugo laibachii Nc14]|eukprot:CCA27777.1 AlNc14C678G12389 [Albugo laibachii Nc14]
MYENPAEEMSRKRIRDDDVDLRPKKKMSSPWNAPSAKAALSHLYSASTRETSSLPEIDGDTTLILVTYSSSKCLICLTLLHEVVLLSTESTYIWMVKPKEEAPACDCEWNTYTVIQSLPSHSLRPMSAVQIHTHLTGERFDPSSIPSDPTLNGPVPLEIAA